jgi:HEAT repeat protein
MSAKRLEAIFDAERALRDAEQNLMREPHAVLSKMLTQAVTDSKNLEDDAESEMRLARLADLCAQVTGPAMVEALIEILDHPTPFVRVQAAEAMTDMAYDRYAEVARAVEQAVERKDLDLALRELPWIIVEIGEPSAASLIKLFLTHPTAEVIASAIEALAELGDPSAVNALRPLLGDTREVDVDDSEGELTAQLGELAEQAIEELQANQAQNRARD